MGKRGVTPLHRGGRVGDDGGEVVGEDCGDDDGPRWHSGATGSEGERAPSFFFFLDLPLDGRRVSPLVHGLHGTRGARAPPRLDLSLCLSLFLRSLILPFHHFFYIRRSVTPIGLKLSPRFFS